MVVVAIHFLTLGRDCLRTWDVNAPDISSAEHCGNVHLFPVRAFAVLATSGAATHGITSWELPYGRAMRANNPASVGKGVCGVLPCALSRWGKLIPVIGAGEDWSVFHIGL